MGLLPKKNADRIAWFQTRTTLWTTNATAIGTTTTQVTDVVTKAAAAATALASQETAQNAAKAATETLNAAMQALTNSGNIVIEQVRTKARTAGDSVYPLANIPVPSAGSPMPPPGEPYLFKVALNTDGSLDLSWKCNNPAGSQGTSYQVYRQNEGAGDFVFLGASGLKAFTDNSLPSGAASVTYKIIAWRSTAAGPAAEFTVKFGVSAGTMTASVVAPKLAA